MIENKPDPGTRFKIEKLAFVFFFFFPNNILGNVKSRVVLVKARRIIILQKEKANIARKPPGTSIAPFFDNDPYKCKGSYIYLAESYQNMKCFCRFRLLLYSCEGSYIYQAESYQKFTAPERGNNLARYINESW